MKTDVFYFGLVSNDLPLFVSAPNIPGNNKLLFLKRNKEKIVSEIKNRATLVCYERLNDSKSFFVSVQAWTVVDISTFLGERIESHFIVRAKHNKIDK